MARVTHAAAHLPIEEVKHRLKHDPRPWCRQRWLVIYNALIAPRKAEEISKHCGVSKGTVHQVICTYNRFGVEAVETPGKGGRRHEYLSLEDEQQFLAPFFVRAETGEIAILMPSTNAWGQRFVNGYISSALATTAFSCATEHSLAAQIVRCGSAVCMVKNCNPMAPDGSCGNPSTSCKFCDTMWR